MKKKISRILGVGVTLAVVTSLLVGALPAAALSGVTATLATGTNVISGTGDYTVTFTVAQELVAGDTITITFPSDTAVAASAVVAAGASISVSPGWIGNATPPPTWGGSAGAGTFTSSGTARTVTYTLVAPDNIGITANVIINLAAGITNPSTPGDYTLTVRTSKETTAVTSSAYTITAPSLYYPGTVELWNPGGYLMNVGNNIGTAIGMAALTGNFTIKVGTGYYDEIVVVDRPVTIVAMEGATPIIADLPATVAPVGGTLTVTAGGNKTATNGGVTLDGLTIMGNAAGPGVLTIQAEGVTVQNCTFTKYGTSLTTPVQTMIDFQTAAATYPSTISGCTFDTTLGTQSDIGILASGDDLTISGCTFVGDYNTTTYAQDYYIQNTGGYADNYNITYEKYDVNPPNPSLIQVDMSDISPVNDVARGEIRRVYPMITVLEISTTGKVFFNATSQTDKNIYRNTTLTVLPSEFAASLPEFDFFGLTGLVILAGFVYYKKRKKLA